MVDFDKTKTIKFSKIKNHVNIETDLLPLVGKIADVIPLYHNHSQEIKVIYWNKY